MVEKKLYITTEKLIVLFVNWRDFLKAYEKASKSSEVLLRKPEIENGSTSLEDNLFAHC